MSGRSGEVYHWDLSALFVAEIPAEGAVPAPEVLGEIVEALELAWEVSDQMVVDDGGDVDVAASVFYRQCGYSCNDAVRLGCAVVACRDVYV